MLNESITTLVENFANQIVAAVEASVAERIQAAVSGAFGPSVTRAGAKGLPSSVFQMAGRRPKQLCPVPGCSNLAAPVFGMVCAEHKGVSKAKIKQYREERKKANAGQAALLTGQVRKVAKVSGKALQARKLQGQYLGALNGLKPADRNRVKELAKEKGKVVAIKLAQSIKKGK
jgi:hypothetical protein